MPQAVKAVAWAFLGVRKGSDSEQDSNRLRPFQLIVVAFGGTALFVGGLMALVHWVVS